MSPKTLSNIESELHLRNSSPYIKPLANHKWYRVITLEKIWNRRTLSATWRWAMVVVWTGFIFNYTLMNVSSVREQLGWFIELCRILHLPKSKTDDLFHFFSFAVLAFLLAGAVRGAYLSKLTRRQTLFCLLALFNLSMIQEILQYLSPTRVPKLLDVGTNFVGGFTGLAIALTGAAVVNLMTS